MSEKVWEALANELAQNAEEAGKSVVAVGGRRHPASGVLLGNDAVVTVNHGVNRDEEITVVLGPDQRVSARVAGRDPGTDLAALRLAQPVAVTPPRWAAGSLRVGDLMLALGRTWRGNVVASSGVLSGVINAPWRTWRGGELDHFVRPDLNLYSGFSGGPLVNSRGEFTGINTQGLHRSAVTIPAATVTRVTAELLSKGRVERPYLGLAMHTVTLPESLRARLNLKAGEGLLVVHVEPGSPSDKAGVLLGDTLVELDAKNVAGTDEVQDILRAAKIGQEIEGIVMRGGAIAKIKVALEARPAR
jgi:S1-C subfamily serine protease